MTQFASSDIPTCQLTEAARQVLCERYAAKDTNGQILETPEQVFGRVARHIAAAERTWGATDASVSIAAQRFYVAMLAGTFMPNSPTIMNAGRDNNLQYAACFVLPVEDSIHGIFDTQRNAAIIHKSGGGTGFSFSRLRPAGMRVATTSGVCSGPVTFLKTYNSATEAVRQGSARSGANMAILRVDHPDIRDYINCKRAGGITNFNISIAVTDAFMAALADGKKYALLAQPGWPLPVAGRAAGGEVLGELDAREIWNEISAAAWTTGDPGLFFVDRANSGLPNAIPSLQTIEATNPCFAGSTLIETTEGPVKIKDLVGQCPWVRSFSGAEFVVTQASGVFKTRDAAPLLQMRTADGSLLQATTEHLILMAEHQYHPLGTLRIGDHVLSLTGPTQVTSIESAGEAPVFDVTVPTFHNVVANGIVAHNCGEQALPPWGVCTLGHVNLAKFVRNRVVDYDGLAETVELGVRFLDNVLECNPYPLPEIREQSLRERRIGLGVMGWADMLIKLGIPYASDQAIGLAQDLGTFLKHRAGSASRKLADERGPFPTFSESRYCNGPPRRHSNITTIAPTGTTSFFADCNSGIEPLFAIAYEHRVARPEGARILPVVNKTAYAALAERHLDSPEVLRTIADRGRLGELTELPTDIRALLATAHEIPLEWHVRHQAAWQLVFSESCVSKTINLPNEATVDDVRRAYQLAWDLGCMGITVFRDGSKGEQVLNAGNSARTVRSNTPLSVPSVSMIEPMPDEVTGKTFRIQSSLGKVLVTVNSNANNEPTEVFVRAAKSGSDVEAFAEAIGRLISTFMRFNWLPDRTQRFREIITQLQGIGGHEIYGFGPRRITSVPDAIAKALDRFLDPQPPGPRTSTGTVSDPKWITSDPRTHTVGTLCADCGAASVVVAEGCRSCLSCGSTRC